MTLRALPTAKAQSQADAEEALKYVTEQVTEHGIEGIVCAVLHPNREASICYVGGERWLEMVGLIEVVKSRLLED